MFFFIFNVKNSGYVLIMITYKISIFSFNQLFFSYVHAQEKINCWQETPIIALFRNVSWFIFLFKVGFRVTLFSSNTISSCLWNLKKKRIEKWKRSCIIVTHMPDPKWLYCFPIYNNSSIEHGSRIMPTYYVLFGSLMLLYWYTQRYLTSLQNTTNIF